MNVTPSKPSVLSGPALILLPFLAETMPIGTALLVQQIYYWTRKTCLKNDDGDPVVCYTYLDWQKQFPFLSTRWLKKMVGDLEKDNWISVERCSSYNRYMMSETYKTEIKKHQQNGDMPPLKNFVLDTDALVKVFAALVVSVGMVEAIILQLLHIRTYKKADWWVKKTAIEWRNDLLRFVSVRTVERALHKLDKLGLIIVEKAINKGHNSKRMRVNYIGLAERLGIDVDGMPEVHTQTVKDSSAIANSALVSANISPSSTVCSPLV